MSEHSRTISDSKASTMQTKPKDSYTSGGCDYGYWETRFGLNRKSQALTSLKQVYSFKALGQIRAELMQQKEIQIVITLRHITLLLISTKATFKASASILLLVITASFSLLLFSH